MIEFVILASLICGIALVAITRPLWRSSAGTQMASAGTADIEVYKDQLEELSREIERGAISDAEAEPTRIELSRRLLAADAAAQTETSRAPKTASTMLIVAIALGTLGGGAALYSVIGAPGYKDAPLAGRFNPQDRMTQAEAEADVAPLVEAEATVPEGRDAELIEQLREVLANNPEDPRGYALLASSMARYGEFAEARAAQERVVALTGDAAPGSAYAALAEYMILAARGYISPQADQVLSEALRRDPNLSQARFYSGVSLSENGRPDLALGIWARLYAEAPPDAPWRSLVAAQAAAVSSQNGLPLPPAFTAASRAAGPSAPGPTAEDMEAAAEMTPEDREAMIRGMVDGLSQRLATEGGSVTEWARLISALGVLGETQRAAAIYSEAQSVFAADPEAMGIIEQAGKSAGLTQ